MRMVRIEAVSEIYTAIVTVSESRSVAKCKSIRLCYELSRKRVIEDLVELYLPERIGVGVYIQDHTASQREEAKDKAHFEFWSNDKYKLKVNIAAYEEERNKKRLKICCTKM